MHVVFPIEPFDGPTENTAASVGDVPNVKTPTPAIARAAVTKVHRMLGSFSFTVAPSALAGGPWQDRRGR